MKEKDVFDELIEIGKRRGVLTYDEINEALPSEFFTTDEIEDLMDLLNDMGVRIVDADESRPLEEAEAPPEYEKTEDLVKNSGFRPAEHDLGIDPRLTLSGHVDSPLLSTTVIRQTAQKQNIRSWPGR